MAKQQQTPLRTTFDYARNHSKSLIMSTEVPWASIPQLAEWGSLVIGTVGKHPSSFHHSVTAGSCCVTLGSHNLDFSLFLSSCLIHNVYRVHWGAFCCFLLFSHSSLNLWVKNVQGSMVLSFCHIWVVFHGPYILKNSQLCPSMT